MRRAALIMLAGALTSSCWSSATPAPSPAAVVVHVHVPPRPAQPPSKRVLAAEFGRFAPDGTFTATLDLDLYPGSLFGWRIRTECASEMIPVDEEIKMPSAGEWTPDQDLTVSADATTARSHAEVVCSSEGWMEKVWSASPGDPPGDWVVRVKTPGYATATFTPTFTPKP